MTLTPAPYFDDIADGPVGGAAHWVTTADGLRIRVGHWPSGDTAKGTVLLFPGRTEYIEKYGRDAKVLTEHGFAMVAIDWRGQGLSDRTSANRSFGDVAEFADYQHDVRAVLAHVRALGLPEPYYLLAHSMGGCIGLRALYERLPVMAAAFSAPMWGIQMAPALRPVAWGLTSISTALGFDTALAPGQSAESMMTRTPFDTNPLTNDSDMYAYMVGQLTARPDLSLGGPTMRWLGQSLVEMRALAQRPSPSAPCLTFLGTQESIVDPARIKARMAAWPGGRLEILDACKHEVLMERPAIRTQVLAQIIAHFDGHREPARQVG